MFGNAPANMMNEKFSDLLQFTTQVSRLMVTEIRRRASNKSTGTSNYSNVLGILLTHKYVLHRPGPFYLIVRKLKKSENVV